MKKTLNTNITYCILTFVLYAFIGWIYEVILEFYYGNGFINRGFLFGPYLPIYGFGALVILAVLYKFSKRKIKLGKISITPVIIFISIFILTTTIEFIAGSILDMILETRLWDYSNYKFNINGLICLSASTRFAIGGTTFIYILQPLFDKLIDFMNVKLKNILAYGILSIITIDFILKIF